MRVGVAVAAVAAVAVGVGAGVAVTGGSEEPASTETTAGEARPLPAPVRVRLETTPAGGDAQGEAAIGLDDEFAPFMDLDLANLPPLRDGETYVPWIEISGGRGLPVPAPIAVAKDGSFAGRLDLATPLVGVVDAAREIQVLPLSRPELVRLSEEIEAGGGEGDSLALRSPRGAVLSGTMPGR